MKQDLTRRIPLPDPGLSLPVLPERLDRLFGLLAHANSWITEANGVPETVYVSPGVETAIGFTPEEIMCGDCVHIHPRDEEVLVKGAIELARKGRPMRCVIRLRDKEENWRWIEVTSQASYVSESGGYQSMSLNRDVTPLVEAQQDLRESEERYRLVSEMSRDLISESSTSGETIYISPAVFSVLGYTQAELPTMTPFALVHPDDVSRLKALYEQSFLTGETVHFPAYRVRRKDGRYLWFESSGFRYESGSGNDRMLSVTHNVTDELEEAARRREIEEQMVSGQKLESLGVMAGGIAHDFNNLLTPILGEASLGLEDLPEESPVWRRLQKIRRAAERAAALTQQMLSYAGKGPLQLEHLDLSRLVDEMGRLFESAVSGKTLLAFDLAEDLPMVEADAAQLSQVVINLISNASESLPDGEGTIDVRTGRCQIDVVSAKAMFAEQVVPGPHVFLEVVDSGCGMDPGTLSKIFDPFFTTKFTGRGLGLAAVAGIVRGHRGAVEIESDPGDGTVFRVLFPVAEGNGNPERLCEDVRAGRRLEGTLLVIDDDAAVCELAVDILSRIGLDVVTTADGHEGVEIFAERSDEIRLVLLDRTMPTMSGLETYRRLCQIRPDVRVVLVSGYSEERAAAELADTGLAGFMQKPFLPETLVEVVRGMIEPSAAGS